jgi:hypothetical protein
VALFISPQFYNRENTWISTRGRKGWSHSRYESYRKEKNISKISKIRTRNPQSSKPYPTHNAKRDIIPVGKHYELLVITYIGKTKYPVTLVNFQLDAQNSYLFIYNTFIKILYTFRALPCSSTGGLRRNCIYAASGIVTVCRWLSCAPVKKELFLTGAQDSHLQRVTIPEAACIQLRRRPVEDEQGNARNM